MKIKFDSNDDLSLNKQWTFSTMTIIVRSVFEGDDKYYPQIYLVESFYKLWKMIQLHKIEDSKGIDLDKTDQSKKYKACQLL